MADLIEPKKLAGRPFHVCDCYVWAEIFYLDSPTDYRECLPQQKKPRAGQGDLIMLDSARSRSGKTLETLLIAVFALFMIAGYFLYLILESF